MSKKKPAPARHVVKPPAEGDSTVYIVLQYYSREKKRTLQDRLARFNLFDAVDAVAPALTNLGLERGYVVLPEHLDMAKKWLRKNGKKVTDKVPARVRRKLQAEVEARVRAELGAPPSASFVRQQPPATASATTTKTPALADDMRYMLDAIDRVKKRLGALVEFESKGSLTSKLESDWHMCSFAFSEALEHATAAGIGRPKSWQSREWVEEAIKLGYYTRRKLEASQRAAAKKGKSTSAAMGQ